MPTSSFDLIPGEAEFIANCEREDTATVLEHMDHPNYILRRSAAVVLLLRGGKDVLESAIRLCTSHDFKKRQMGVLIIGEINIDDNMYKKIIYFLKSIAITDSSARVRAEAIRALGLRCKKDVKLQSDIIPILKKNINSHSVAIRWSITGALVSIKNKEAIPFLEKLLQDSDLDIRNWAAFAVNVTELDSKKIRFGLIKMLKEPYYDARCEAITALAVRHDKRAAPALKKELAEEEVRDSMIEAAGSLGDPRFIPILEGLLERFDDSDGLILSSLNKLKAVR